MDEIDELIEIENLQESEDDYNESPPSDIVAYNELRSCADLLRMTQENQLEIQPEFQREVVWNKSMQTRLIDSLVKQLPIPSLCISLDYKTQERFVIDGLQRIATIVNFLDTQTEWKLTKLPDIDEKISGKTNLIIKSKNYEIFSKVQNTVLPITVLRCDYSKKSHMNYLFTIFHRLNSGGSKLTNQEIRNCIFSGTFNNFLKRAIKYENFKTLLNIDDDKTYRFSNEELVLRFLAFHKNLDKYNGSLSKFLNDFMEENRNRSETLIEEYEKIFTKTIDIILHKIADNRNIEKFSKAFLEALFVGISKNLNSVENFSDLEIKSKFETLKNDVNFSYENLKEGLAQKEKVKNRMFRSIEIFSS